MLAASNLETVRLLRFLDLDKSGATKQKNLERTNQFGEIIEEPTSKQEGPSIALLNDRIEAEER